MPSRSQFFFALTTTAVISIGILLITSALRSPSSAPLAPITATTSQAASVGVAASSPASTTPSAASSTRLSAKPKVPKPPVVKEAVVPTPSASTTIAQKNKDEITRIQDPYPTAPLSFTTINEQARAALVNILCTTQGGGLKPISGSGVIIDPRGVILTNAHVAQYILLSESPRVNLSCVIRIGAPARARFSADVFYISPAWVHEHVSDITADRPTGTGEHDYALLRITKTVDGSPLPTSFPALSLDTREAIGFLDDQILAAAYPAEFLGSVVAQYDLYPVTSVTTVQKLLTFTAKWVDVISLGGVAEAQSGSSGGPVVNQWGRLIGIITTTSNGATTGERDLHAVTMSYIDRDITAETTHSLQAILTGDIANESVDFKTNVMPGLIQLYLAQILKRQN